MKKEKPVPRKFQYRVCLMYGNIKWNVCYLFRGNFSACDLLFTTLYVCTHFHTYTYTLFNTQYPLSTQNNPQNKTKIYNFLWNNHYWIINLIQLNSIPILELLCKEMRVWGWDGLVV